METGGFISHIRSKVKLGPALGTARELQLKLHHCQHPVLQNGNPRPPAHSSASLALSPAHPAAAPSAQHPAPLTARPSTSPGRERRLQLSSNAETSKALNP